MRYLGGELMAKVLIIYYSVHHGNTKRLLDPLSRHADIELLNAKNIDDYNFHNYDIIGMASGIYHGRHHSCIFNVLEAFPNEVLIEKLWFVISTSGSNNKKYNKPLIDAIISRGGTVLGDYCCRGFNTYGIWKVVGGISKGHPNQRDKDNAMNFVNERLKNNST